MNRTTKISLILALCGFACSIGLRAFDPVIPDIAVTYNVSIKVASLSAAIFALAYGFGQLLMGPLSDKLGRYRVLTLAMIMVTFFSLLALIPNSYFSLILSRFGAGLFASAVVASSLALLGQLFSGTKRGVIIARFMMAVITAQLLGAVVMSHVSPYFEIMFLVLAILPLIGLVLLYALRNEPILNEQSQGKLTDHIGSIFKQTHLPLIALLGFLDGTLVFGPIPYISVKLATFSASTTIAGYAIACFAIGGLVFAVISQYVIRLLKQSQFTVGIICLSLVWLLIAYSSTYWVILLAMFLVGLSFYILHNMLQVNASNCYPPARASAMSLFAFAFFLGQGTGPLLFGSFVNLIGLNQSFIVFALSAFVVGVVSWPKRYKISDQL